MNTNKPISVVGYARISCERHLAEPNVVLSAQRCLQQYGVSEELFFWDIEFDRTDKRRGYDDVLALIDQGSIQKIVVYCFDILRETSLQWQDFVDILSRKNIEIVLLDEGRFIHVNGVGNILAETLHHSVEAKQRYIHSQNAQKGHERRRNKKKPLVVPFGYIMSEKDEIAINLSLYKNTGKTYYEIARELVECFLETESVSQTIADFCDEYGTERVGTRNLDFPRDPKALKTWLTNPFLQGTLVFFARDEKRRTEYPNNHQAIITRKEAIKIHQIMERRKIIKKTDTLVNPLAGLMYCAGCGCQMKVSQSKGGQNSEYHYYVTCKGAYPRVGHKRVCDRRSSYGLEISNVINFVIGAIIRSEDRLHLLKPISETDEFQKTPEILKLEDNIRKMESLGLPEVQRVIDKAKTKLEDLIAVALKEIREDRSAIENIQSKISRPRFWQSATPEELRDIFPLLVKKVTCDQGQVTVELLF